MVSLPLDRINLVFLKANPSFVADKVSQENQIPTIVAGPLTPPESPPSPSIASVDLKCTNRIIGNDTTTKTWNGRQIVLFRRAREGVALLCCGPRKRIVPLQPLETGPS